MGSAAVKTHNLFQARLVDLHCNFQRWEWEMAQQLQSPENCLHLLNYLILKLQNSQESFQEELTRSPCIGQVAVDMIERNCQLLNQWIEEWSGQEGEIAGEKQQQKRTVITFYELLVVCEIYVDSFPEITQKLKELDLLFLPKCSLIDPSESRPNTSRSQESNKLTGRKARK
jgi:hypothetical protein